MTRWKTTLVLLVAVLSGVAIGAQLFSSELAEAQTPTYRQCFFAHQESVDVNDESVIDGPSRSRRVTIPGGWTVVGGGGAHAQGQSRVGVIMLCR